MHKQLHNEQKYHKNTVYMAKKTYKIAIVGATGIVGQEIVDILEQREFPTVELIPLASKRSQDKTVFFADEDVAVQVLTPDSFKNVDIAFFTAGSSVSKEFAPIARQAGAVVIDNSSAFRMDKEVPLIIPEVNGDLLSGKAKPGIIANPNCSTIQMVMALAPLHQKAQIKRIVVSTYQAVSGAGNAAIDELLEQSKNFFAGAITTAQKFPHRIAFNCIPHIDVFLEDGSTKEETKIVEETKKIFANQEIAIAATAVRVPVLTCHSEAVFVEFNQPITVEETKAILANSSGLKVLDEPAQHKYPLANELAGQDEVYVGRIRQDKSVKHGLSMWIVADNVRKGAALNAVQIAEELVR